MKRLIAACTLLLVMLVAALAHGRYAYTLTQDLIARLEQAQHLALQSRWDTALLLTQDAYQRWQDHHFYLHVLMRHTDTDEILLSFRSVQQAIVLEEPDQYTTINATLMTQLELLAEMEAPSLVNVL